jgi:hypothetical protein
MTEKTWTTAQLTEDFTVLGFSYGVCVVERKADGVRGTLTFHREEDVRVYTDFLGEDDDDGHWHPADDGPSPSTVYGY